MAEGRAPESTTNEWMGRVRLAIYESFRDHGRAPAPIELAAQFETTPVEMAAVLEELEQRWDAIVRIPGSSSIWMAEPFSAVPTNHRTVTTKGSWWGNCIWDALGILAALQSDGHVETRCPSSGIPLEIEVQDGAVNAGPGVVHFAVPASRWWENVGFT